MVSLQGLVPLSKPLSSTVGLIFWKSKFKGFVQFQLFFLEAPHSLRVLPPHKQNVHISPLCLLLGSATRLKYLVWGFQPQLHFFSSPVLSSGLLHGKCTPLPKSQFLHWPLNDLNKPSDFQFKHHFSLGFLMSTAWVTFPYHQSSWWSVLSLSSCTSL